MRLHTKPENSISYALYIFNAVAPIELRKGKSRISGER